MQRQLRRLGLGHDERRSLATTDVDFYHWTQWIFLQIHGAWYDTDLARRDRSRSSRPSSPSGDPACPTGRAWAELTVAERGAVLDSYRLVYQSDSMVNWCPGLGTVLANEEVTADGRSDRGNFPVFRKHLRQWMMRITAYSDRLPTTSSTWTGRRRSSPCSATGSAVRTAPRCVRRGGRARHRGVHHPARHPVRRELRDAGPRARAGGPARRRVVPRGRRRPLDRRRRHPGRGRRGLPQGDRGEDGPRAPGEQGEDRRLPGHLRGQSRERAPGSDLHRGLRAHRLRHRRDHGRPRSRPP